MLFDFDRRTSKNGTFKTFSIFSANFIDCPTPTELVFGYPKSTEFKEGSKVSMACNNGYSVFGNPILTCLPGGIWERDQDLECREGSVTN